MTIETRLRKLLAAAGVEGQVHVMDVDSPTTEVALEADDPVVLSSVFKVPLVLAFLRASEEGLDPRRLVRIGARRTRGSPGLASLSDPVSISLRDLAVLAITVSDVAAADALYDELGGDAALNGLADSLGLTRTRFRGCCRDLLSLIDEDTGGSPELLADPDVFSRLRVRDPAFTSAAAPRDLTKLLGSIWRAEAASSESCEELREMMRRQALRPRVAAGFPEPGWQTATKSGTLPGIRNDIGVVESPAGRRFAVAVCIRDPDASMATAHAEALLGRVARMAVDALLGEADR